MRNLCANLIYIIIIIILQRHTIQNLETFTQYSVSLAVFNPEGKGPNASVVVMTDEGSKYSLLKVYWHGE